MTGPSLIVSSLLLLLAAPAPGATTGGKIPRAKGPGGPTPTAKGPLGSQGKPKPKAKKNQTAKKPAHTKTKRRRGKARKRSRLPNFVKLLSPQLLTSKAKDDDLIPQGGSSTVTALATLTAANPRQGEFGLNFRCAHVKTAAALGAQGYAEWHHQLIDFCRTTATQMEPGVEITFPTEADVVYAVECNLSSDPRLQIRHKIGLGGWTHPVTMSSTANPVHFFASGSGGLAQVRIALDPAHSGVPVHRIRSCRVSRLG
ncbi:MAG: hypothetical protein AAF721_09140 [Myxococcota bacterium]